ncbi:MAG: hypothetical protein N3A02_06050, partial [Rectinema sp.]|nr:hypothetical protein [Rectinema sp.]
MSLISDSVFSVSDRKQDVLEPERRDPFAETFDISRSLTIALKSDPVMTSRASRMSSELNIPIDVVQRNAEEASRIMRANEIISATRIGSALAETLKDANFAAQAHDDVEKLAAIEDSARTLSNTVRDVSVSLLMGIGVQIPQIAIGLYRLTPPG